MKLRDIQRNSEEDVRAFLEERQSISCETRQVLSLLFDDPNAGADFVDVAMAKRGMQLTGQPAR